MYLHGGDVYSHPNMIDFSANINFLGAPKSVVEAAKSAMDGICHYPQADCKRLRQAIASLEQTQAGQVVCGNGAAEVIFSLALAEKPKKAMVFAPTFQEYEQALRSVGCEVVYETLREGYGFQIREIPKKLDPTIDMLFLCNPNNPTGTLTRQDLLRRLLFQCEQNGILLVVDECFFDFVEQKEKNQSMKRYLKASKLLFIVKAFTKTFGIPGLRLGYGLCNNPQILERMHAVTQPWNVSVPAQEAGIAAAGELLFLEKTRQAVTREKQFLLEQLSIFLPRGEDRGNLEKRSVQGSLESSQFFIELYGHAANFIFFRSIPKLDQELMRYKILIRNCSNFPGLSEGWYRIAVRTREENKKLIACLKQIKEEIEKNEI